MEQCDEENLEENMYRNIVLITLIKATKKLNVQVDIKELRRKSFRDTTTRCTVKINIETVGMKPSHLLM